MADAKRTYTLQEVAEMLGIGRNNAYRAAQAGEIPTIRIGRRLLVPKAALEKMLAIEASVTKAA